MSQPYLRITADLNQLATLRCFVQDVAMAFKVDPAIIPELLLAVNEIATNIIIHGYQSQPGTIEVEMKREEDGLMICLRDEAPPFDPTLVPSPDLSLPLEKRPLGGLGIHLTRQLMDEMIHQVRPQGGNELILKKKEII